MSNVKIRPLYDHILVEPLKLEDKTKSGIYLPQTADKEKPDQGKVIAVGEGKVKQDGKTRKLSVKIGDIVLFSKYSPTEIKINNKEYFILKEDDVLAIIEN